MKIKPTNEPPVLKATLTAFQLQAGSPNIHIDMVRLRADCYHEAIGEVFYLDGGEYGIIPGATAPVQNRKSQPQNRYHLKSSGISSVIDSDGHEVVMADFLDLRCCPGKLLQGHNLFGHDDLPSYAFDLLEFVTRTRGISVDDKQKAQWKVGNGIRITEIHLTTNFLCPREDVLPIIGALDTNQKEGKQRIYPTSITLGRKASKRSSYHLVTVYDKYQEMLDTAEKKPINGWSKLLELAKDCVRVEVKLYSKELKARDLNSVSAWKTVNVPDLYFEVLRSYKLTSAIQRQLTVDEEQMLTKGEWRAYMLWMNGAPVADAYGRTTAWKYQKSILEKTQIDILSLRRPEKLPTIELSEVFARGNTLQIPVWACGTTLYHPPAGSSDETKGSGAGSALLPKRGRGIGQVPVYEESDGVWPINYP